MKNSRKNTTDETWDNRDLGASEKHVRKVSPSREKAVDDGLGMQSISIRLQKCLIDNLKELAEQDGIGYQPYVRQLLTRHVREVNLVKREKKKIKTRKSHAGTNY